MDLRKWTYVSPFGFSSSIYAKGKRRILVDKDDELIIGYNADRDITPEKDALEKAT